MAHRYIWITIFFLISLLWFMFDLSSAGNNDPRYIGCYEDNSHFRASGWEQFTRSITAAMTIDACAAVCTQQRRFLSGLINGNECWCTNTTIFSRTNCIECCKIPCEGNRSLTCGGRNSFDVYEAVVDGRYLGCYNDLSNNRRVFRRFFFDNHATDQCIQWCGQQNYTIAGTQSLTECWCGNSDYTKHGRCITEQNCTCNERCTRNKTEICGGQWAMSVYRPECREQERWGTNCANICHCNNGAPCNISTGRCPNNECAPGWIGPTCNKKCETGKFGHGCKFECKCNNSADCDKITGACDDNKCSPGFTGPHNSPACQTECQNGKFGVNCKQECHCLSSQLCDIKSGICLNGFCASGYDLSDKTCQTECQTGTYGFGCRQKCQCGNTEDCDKVTGNCKNNKNILVPTISSLLGVAVLTTAILGSVLLCRKRNTDGKNKETPEDQHCEEEPYHHYEYIPDDVQNDPAVENTRQVPNFQPGARSKKDVDYIDMNRGLGRCHYENSGQRALYENAA